MSGYIGTTPVPQATQHREAFTANADQTTFATAGYTVGFIDVWLNGVKLAAADVTVTNGSDIVLASAAAANDIIEYVAFVPFNAANQTFTGATVINSLNINSDGATVTGIKDEDNMASNDANKLATQQSIKAYVDSTVAATNEVVEDTTPQLGGDLASNGNDILMADNDKVIFGAGSDLQLYHDGSHSYISDQGTGDLRVLAATSFVVKKSDASENMITANADGAVGLSYDGSQKFATSSGGATVTGTLLVDGLSMGDSETAYFGTDNDLRILHTGSHGQINNTVGNLTLDVAGDIILDSDAANWRFKDAGTSILEVGSISSGTSFYNAVSDASMHFRGNDGGSAIQAMTIDYANGGRLGIGTTSPNRLLSLKHASQAEIGFKTGSVSNGALIYYNDSEDQLLLRAQESSDSITFQTGGTTERMRINSSGNVAIGSTNNGVGGSIDLSVGSTSSSGGITLWSPTSGTHSLGFGDGYSGTDRYRGYVEYAHNGDSMRFATSATERMRIDSSGTLAVGTTVSPTWTVFDGRIRLGARGVLATTTGSTQVIHNAYYDGSYKRIGGTDFAGRYYQNDGSHVWDTAVAGAADSAISFVERMRIQNSGNVGIGTTSPSAKLEITTADNTNTLALVSTDADAGAGPNLNFRRSSGSPADGDGTGAITWTNNNDAGEGTDFCRIDTWTPDVSNGTEDGEMNIRVMKDGTLRNRIGIYEGETVINQEALDVNFRVEGSGLVNLFKVDAGAGSGKVGINCDPTDLFYITGQATSTAMGIKIGTNGYNGIEFDNATGSLVGRITINSGTTAYVTSSDYRLKENVVDMTGATTRLKQLKPKRFNWIADDTNTLIDGFLAHEVSSIVPEAVAGEKDAVHPDGHHEAGEIDPQGLDYSKLVPLLVKTIQELEARITALEA